MSWRQWPRYVSIAELKARGKKAALKLQKSGKKLHPVNVEGRIIANTFWGKAWCKNLEFYSDYENRLPRGRTYLRNGFVVDLKVVAGKIEALVWGSSMYNVEIAIKPLTKKKWRAIIAESSGKIDSLLELLQGKFSKNIMEIITHPESGLFPHPKEIKLSCSCPDSAYMCKHVAAVLYGVGARLDLEPETLFILRQVDYTQLIAAAGSVADLVLDVQSETALADADLSSLFGIDIEEMKQKPAKTKRKNAPKEVKNRLIL